MAEKDFFHPLVSAIRTICCVAGSTKIITVGVEGERGGVTCVY